MAAKLRLLVLLLGSTSALAAPLPRGTVARAGEIALRLRRVTLVREGRLSPAPDGRPLPGSHQRTASVLVDLELGSRNAEALDGLIRGPLEGAFSARDDRGRVARVRGEVLEEDSSPVLRLTVEGLSPSVRSLRSLEGELRAYAAGRRIRFHVPWLKDEVPVSVEVDGGAATLRRFHLVGADSTLWISIRPPEGFRMANATHPGTLSARAVDIDGNLVNGGGVTAIDRTRAGDEPEFRFFAPGLRRTPSRVMVDVLCVRGAARGIPFRLSELPLPVRRD